MLLQLLLTAAVAYSQWPYWPQWGPWQACNPNEPDCTCPCDYGHCYWWGDPHLRTFDGLWHHFQGWPFAPLSYRYVTPCNSDFNLVPFQILTRHRFCGGGLQCSDWIDVRLYNPNGIPNNNYLGFLRINNGLSVIYTPAVGGAVSLPNGRYNVGSGVYVVVTRSGWTVDVAVFTGILCRYPNPDYIFANLRPDFIVRATSWMNRIDVQLNEYYKYLVCGLCGYWSGTHHDDFTINGKFYQSQSLQCRHYDSSVPQSMWQYTPWDWWHVNSFGLFWLDRGLYVRRLHEGPELPDGEGLQNENQARTMEEQGLNPKLVDPGCPDRAEQACQNIFNIQFTLDPTFCIRCAGEACGRWNAVITGLDNSCNSVEDCVAKYCPALCDPVQDTVETCPGIDQEPPDANDPTNPDDTRQRFEAEPAT